MLMHLALAALIAFSVAPQTRAAPVSRNDFGKQIASLG